MKRICPLLLNCMLSVCAFSQDSTGIVQNKNPSAEKISSLPKQIDPAETSKASAEIKSRLQLQIYPNPVKNKLTLGLRGFENGLASVKIVDTKGNLIRKENRLLVSSDEEIIMFVFLKTGVYFIMVSQKEKNIKKKFVVI